MKTRIGLALVVAGALVGITGALNWSDSINRDIQLRSQLQPKQEIRSIWDDKLIREIASNSFKGAVGVYAGILGGGALLSFGSRGLVQNYRNKRESENYS